MFVADIKYIVGGLYTFQLSADLRSIIGAEKRRVCLAPPLGRLVMWTLCGGLDATDR